MRTNPQVKATKPFLKILNVAAFLRFSLRSLVKLEDTITIIPELPPEYI